MKKTYAVLLWVDKELESTIEHLSRHDAIVKAMDHMRCEDNHAEVYDCSSQVWVRIL